MATKQKRRQKSSSNSIEDQLADAVSVPRPEPTFDIPSAFIGVKVGSKLSLEEVIENMKNKKDTE